MWVCSCTPATMLDSRDESLTRFAKQSLDTGRNIATSILFLVLILQEQSLGAVLVGYGLSVPYNIVATVGVWRSAKRYGGPSLYANLARIVTVTLMAGLTLT